MKSTILVGAFTLSISNLNAQDSTRINPLTLSGYVETYYSYDFGNPANHERPSFFYSFNRHNEANLNLGFVKANYSTDKVRGNFALMAGTYPQYNLAGEEGLLKNIIQEAIIEENKTRCSSVVKSAKLIPWEAVGGSIPSIWTRLK